eukprot:TRINITY_DN2675_c1_g1_i2.p1 TRINITY_DN2675_c1_g1~~TRINITY_DN2675_c1_g1_i2.p1  ORF type:complete len:253 (+),score=31.91 TRINITY_DN2675_c1_g1_i2:26-784(+)
MSTPQKDASTPKNDRPRPTILIQTKTQEELTPPLPIHSFQLSPKVLVVERDGASHEEHFTEVLQRYHTVAPGPFTEGRACEPYMSPVSSCTRDMLFQKADSTPSFAYSAAKTIIDTLTEEFRNGGTESFSRRRTKEFAQLLTSVCSAAKTILQNDPVLVKLQSPVYIMGDIHGNYSDMALFMNQLTTFGQLEYTANRFLFLGDYVDRGPASVEVVAYLIACKVLAPNSVYLLRGNHELPGVNGDIQFRRPSR